MRNAALVILLAAYQQYLIPIIANSVPGAFGSIWQTEFTASNLGAAALPIQAPRCPFGSLCPTGGTIDANSDQRMVLYPQQPGPNPGAFFYVASDQAAFFAAELRVRDLSQQSRSWGTEVPVVNASEFRDALRLVDVPADPNFRVLLRVYANVGATAVQVRVQNADGTVVLNESLPMIASAPPAGSADGPAYAQLAIPAGAAGDRFRIDVTSPTAGHPVWAFASITNNTTQELTLVTPQPIPKIATASPASLATGHWGDGGACLDVTSTTATLVDTFADRVTFTPPPLDANGHFETDGTMQPCSPGPAQEPFAVHLTGDVHGTTITITISGRLSVAPMTLTFGSTQPCKPCLLV